MKKVMKCIIIVFIFALLPFGISENFQMPVVGATKSSYHQKSFWYYPWGKSGVHRGVDIFAREGTVIRSSVPGIVLFTGEIDMGGKVVLILGPGWKLHYYAHLKDISVSSCQTAGRRDQIGTVGDSGNAKGKPHHLHYAIFTLIPYFWKMDSGHYGKEKAFFLDPTPYLNSSIL